MKVLVTGAQGMLGTDLLSILEENSIAVVGTDVSQCDITNEQEVRDVLQEVQPTHVINCAAYTDVDKAEEDRELCYQINVTGVLNLVNACNVYSCKFVQISTDYVFSGDAESYAEDALTDPLNYYGQTKYEAEQLIKTKMSDYVIVRTSWLFGQSGKNFVDTILRAAKERDSLRVVTDQVGKPTYTRDLARGIVGILNEGVDVYHITNEGSCTWHELASAAVEFAGISCSIIPCSSEEYVRAATRPARSVLENTKLPQQRHWREALSEYIKAKQ